MKWTLQNGLILFVAAFLVNCAGTGSSEDQDESSGLSEIEEDINPGQSKAAAPKEEVREEPQESKYDLYKKFKLARKSNQFKAAWKAAGDILARNPNDLKVFNGLASMSISQRKYSKARLLLGKVLAKDPQNSAALNNLGVVEMKSNNLRLALINFKKALESNSRNAAASANLGAIYLQYRNYPTAVAALETAIDNGDESIETFNNYAFALGGNGDNSKASRYYEKALAKDQSNLKVMLNYAAHLIERAGDKKKGLKYLNKVRFVANEPGILKRVNKLAKIAEAP